MPAKKSTKKSTKKEAIENGTTQIPQIPQIPQTQERPSIQKQEVAEPSKPVLPQFNQVTQKLFEAPDGTILIGEKDARQLWYRKGNNGKGMFIRPRR